MIPLASAILACGLLATPWIFRNTNRKTLRLIAIVAGLLYVVNEYKRSVQLQRANTQLAREIALTEARLTDRIAELEARLGEREHP